ncbi:RecQ family ATP-dependent DNA helicase [Amnibacterium flavum]|uniref:RecQ family ATP-dependent DNA helicase n=1 Tax=Amnibacterium flavum TaxID=2173173 RepID=UPI001F0C910B|nr:RecQ family ATP-dependent DNA helicase [Amnibacterium flavum]
MTSSTTTDRISNTADELFGWTELRPGLADAIAQVLDGRDVLAIMPTGYGKSAVYKVAGALLPGMTVVVSPLIALQDDQVAGIRDRPTAPTAYAINSAQGERANEEAWREVEGGRVGYLFLSPEQLAREDVIERLAAASVSLFVVDEAHCVSSWGHDFRPDYLRLHDAVDAIGRPTVLAMTATGAGPVRQEIVDRLELRDPVLISRGYDRPNIRLEVVRHSDDDAKRAAVVEDVESLQKPGLLYVGTRRDTERYAEELRSRGLRAAAYHGGLGAKDRRGLHEGFRADEYDVVVATSAFGMGIDKAGIRFVLHAAVTESVDEYYQEVGRSGRDGEPALARLHYRSEDLSLRSFFAGNSPNRSRLERIATALASVERPVSAAELAEATLLSSRQLGPSLSLLIDAGAAVDGDDGISAVSDMGVGEAVAAAVTQAENRANIDESRIAMMRSYAETLSCRRIFLLGYFGEERDEPCGNCDTCTSGTAYEHLDGADQDAGPFPVDATVRHREWGSGTVMKVEDDRITVFFGTEGYRVLSLEAIAEHDLLERV